MISKLKGLGVAMVTPFNSKNEIDYMATERMVEHLISGGVNYIVVLGTTGEAVVLSKEEKRNLVSFAIDKCNGRVPIVMGVGGNNTGSLIKELNTFDFEGVDAILSVTPYYNKPTQQGLLLHYKALAANSPRPIILYNVPGRTGVNMDATTTLTLAHEEEKIIAIKEASGDLNQQSYILRDRPDSFLVLSGDDALALPQFALGFDGVISVIGNAFPHEFSTLVRSALEGKFTEASRVYLKLVEIIDLLFVDGNPAGVKAALSIKGVIDNNIRLPLAPVTDATYSKLEGVIKNLSV